MLKRDEIHGLATQLGRGPFASRFAEGLLVHRPKPRPVAALDADLDDDDEDDREKHQAAAAAAAAANVVRPGKPQRPSGQFAFVTQQSNRNALALDLLGSELFDPYGWAFAPLVKRPGNPYPDRLSIGRAGNCDLVFRSPDVSKLHAHLHLENDRIVRVSDHGSANGTLVNGVAAGPAGLPIAPGDRLTIGSIELEWLSPEAVYALVVSLGEG